MIFHDYLYQGSPDVSNSPCSCSLGVTGGSERKQNPKSILKHMSYPAIRCNNLKIFGYNPDVFFDRSALQVDFSPEPDGPCPGCS